MFVQGGDLARYVTSIDTVYADLWDIKNVKSLYYSKMYERRIPRV